MYIDVVRDVHIGMPEQPGENLYVDSFVIAVCRKRVPEYMLSSVRDVSGFIHILMNVAKNVLFSNNFERDILRSDTS